MAKRDLKNTTRFPQSKRGSGPLRVIGARGEISRIVRAEVHRVERNGEITLEVDFYNTNHRWSGCLEFSAGCEELVQSILEGAVDTFGHKDKFEEKTYVRKLILINT